MAIEATFGPCVPARVLLTGCIGDSPWQLLLTVNRQMWSSPRRLRNCQGQCRDVSTVESSVWGISEDNEIKVDETKQATTSKQLVGKQGMCRSGQVLSAVQRYCGDFRIATGLASLLLCSEAIMPCAAAMVPSTMTAEPILLAISSHFMVKRQQWLTAPASPSSIEIAVASSRGSVAPSATITVLPGMHLVASQQGCSPADSRSFSGGQACSGRYSLARELCSAMLIAKPLRLANGLVHMPQVFA